MGPDSEGAGGGRRLGARRPPGGGDVDSDLHDDLIHNELIRQRPSMHLGVPIYPEGLAFSPPFPEGHGALVCDEDLALTVGRSAS